MDSLFRGNDETTFEQPCALLSNGPHTGILWQNIGLDARHALGPTAVS
ncbi:MAG: hypothetical protein KIH69_017275 [Anaerolineae bacterium]|nr:hypothetical protein [Anaerolineae bacterium]